MLAAAHMATMSDCPIEWTCDGCPEGCSANSDAGLPLWANLLIAAGLVLLSGLFSGLTLGLLSLDPSGLEILAEAGEKHEQYAARKIMPLRRNGNLLLCTLLIGNVIVNSFLSILLAGITSGVIGLVASSTLIVLLGEIVPQAVCSRHGLLIGSKTRYITWFFIIALYIVAKPISMALDFVLGKEVGTMYTRDELKKLLQMHVVGAADQGSGDGITHDDHNLLAGALEYFDKTVKDVMTPVERVFMLEASTNLSFDVMLEIYKSGYTRIPVYEGSKDNILGVLYVKDLILVDPDDEIEVQTVVSFRGAGQVRYVLDTTPLNQVFKIFKASYTHLMVAVSFCDPVTNQRLDTSSILTNAARFMFQAAQATKQVTGVITLEDILEEVIKDEIVDEYDVHVSNETMERIKKGRDRPDISNFLSLFEHKVRESTKLSRQEVHAITAFLTARVKQFALFEGHSAQLRQLVTACTVLDVDDDKYSDPDDAASDRSADLANQLPQTAVGERIGSHTVIYNRSVPTDLFTLVLQGWTTVWAGEEAFESELGPWSFMGQHALTEDPYRPDFGAITNGKCRLLRIERGAYRRAVQSVDKVKHAPPSARPRTRTLSTLDSDAVVGVNGARGLMLQPPPVPPGRSGLVGAAVGTHVGLALRDSRATEGEPLPPAGAGIGFAHTAGAGRHVRASGRQLGEGGRDGAGGTMSPLPVTTAPSETTAAADSKAASDQSEGDAPGEVELMQRVPPLVVASSSPRQRPAEGSSERADFVRSSQTDASERDSSALAGRPIAENVSAPDVTLRSMSFHCAPQRSHGSLSNVVMLNGDGTPIVVEDGGSVHPLGPYGTSAFAPHWLGVQSRPSRRRHSESGPSVHRHSQLYGSGETTAAESYESQPLMPDDVRSDAGHAQL